MNTKKLSRLIQPGMGLYFFLLFAFAAAALLLDYYYLGAAMAGTGLLLLLYFKIDSFRRRREISSYIQTATDTLETAAKGEMPFPMALIKLSTGEMVWGNDAFNTITEQKSGTRTAPYSAKSSKPYGGSYVEIDLSSQKLWLYKDGERIVTTNLVSGSVAEGHRTPTGVYSIYAKQTDRYLSGEGYRSWVNYWMPFLGGYGLHDASWRSSFGGTIYHYDGSHGCVNLPSSAAKKVYNNVSVGTKVILYGGKTEVPDLEQKLSGTTSYTVSEGDKSFKLDVKAKYSKATLTYTSSDTNVVTVSSNGTVTIKGAGTATITVKAEAFEFYTGAELKVTITVQSGGTAPSEPSEPTEPKPTEPQPTEPKPTEPQPTEPKPTEPQPTEPKPTEPQPTEPKPTEPAPTDPAPSEPAEDPTE